MPDQPKFKNDETDRLFEAILLLKSKEECYRFFEDLMTFGELSSASQRWEVARMLNAGATYQEIVNGTGASSATISRVNRCLHYGADGYNMMIERLAEQSAENDEE